MFSLSSTYLFSNQSNSDLANVALQKSRSLRRLSSGTVFSDPLDQGGGAGLDFKFKNSAVKFSGIENGMLNARSYLEAQADALHRISDSLGRMSELEILMLDVSKNQSEVDAYMLEFDAHRLEIIKTMQQQFNGIDLLSSGASSALTFSVLLNENGDQTMNVTQKDFGTNPFWEMLLGNPLGDLLNGSAYPTSAEVTDEAQLGQAGLKGFMDNVAQMLSENGAEQSRLDVALDHIRQRSFDTAAAGSRVMDTDVAQEVSNLARKDILLQSVASARIQSNVLSEVALHVLGG